MPSHTQCCRKSKSRNRCSKSVCGWVTAAKAYHGPSSNCWSSWWNNMSKSWQRGAHNKTTYHRCRRTRCLSYPFFTYTYFTWVFFSKPYQIDLKPIEIGGFRFDLFSVKSNERPSSSLLSLRLMTWTSAQHLSSRGWKVAGWSAGFLMTLHKAPDEVDTKVTLQYLVCD